VVFVEPRREEEVTSRSSILDRVRRNEPAQRPMPQVPTFDKPPASTAATLATFSAALARMGGVVAKVPAEGSLDASTLDAFIRERFPHAKVICSATPEATGTRDIHSVQRAAELDDVDVGIVRAVFGVAETGSVALTERELVVPALGFLSQHLVVLLDPAAIVPNLHHAYHQRSFFDAAYAVLMTGPSATADIEGVLIRGAQGIRTLTVIALATPGAPGATEARLRS
jgi:L-lactate dehydrogenase complex protein LldG